MPLVIHNGKLLIVDGKLALSTNCCCSFSECEIDFWYDFVSDPPSPVTSPQNDHLVSAYVSAPAAVAIQNMSELWAAANWAVDQNWTSLGCSGASCNYVKRNGQAKLSFRLAYAGQNILFSFNDSRLFASPDWSTDLKAHLRIAGLAGGRFVRLENRNGGWLNNLGNGNWLLGTYSKTNTTMVNEGWRMELR